ncbi:tyrosine-type recombinase/integrase [Mesorhizobium sp. NZP2077]|uniref:tyrosine-type recombinase/integrase n=1 Tax=Mesorhizobium sp. NZP2077 TaxID=2483404 RepID=UPI001FF01CB2|nr:tyrosine-type recombinase/integrase [Mesorhizobium sp. NZP2077]
MARDLSPAQGHCTNFARTSPSTRAAMRLPKAMRAAFSLEPVRSRVAARTNMALSPVFYRYAISRGYAVASPLPPADEEPREPQSAPSYIYSREELQRLFGSIGISRKRSIRLDAETFHMLLLILYGAGLRTSEALHLTMKDVELADAILTVRNTKFYKSRLVPVAPQLAGALRRYAELRADRPPARRNGVRLSRKPRRNAGKETQCRSCIQTATQACRNRP